MKEYKKSKKHKKSNYDFADNYRIRLTQDKKKITHTLYNEQIVICEPIDVYKDLLKEIEEE